MSSVHVSKCGQIDALAAKCSCVWGMGPPCNPPVHENTHLWERQLSRNWALRLPVFQSKFPGDTSKLWQNVSLRVPQMLRTPPKYTPTRPGAPSEEPFPHISSALSVVLTSCGFSRPSVCSLNSGVMKQLSGGALGSQQLHISTVCSWFDAGELGEGVWGVIRITALCGGLPHHEWDLSFLRAAPWQLEILSYLLQLHSDWQGLFEQEWGRQNRCCQREVLHCPPSWWIICGSSQQFLILLIFSAGYGTPLFSSTS